MRPLFPLTLLLFLGACDGGEDAAPTPAAEPQPEQQVQQQRKEEPAERLPDKADEAIALADSGRHGEAVAALEALLEKKADDAAW